MLVSVMKKINVIIVLLVLFGCFEIVEAQRVSRPNLSISRAVQKYTDRESQGLGKIKITKSDVQDDWALVWGRAVARKVDDAQYLLHREKNGWKVLVMGTALVGTGEEYKVPRPLRKRWNL